MNLFGFFMETGTVRELHWHNRSREGEEVSVGKDRVSTNRASRASQGMGVWTPPPTEGGG